MQTSYVAQDIIISRHSCVNLTVKWIWGEKQEGEVLVGEIGGRKERQEEKESKGSKGRGGENMPAGLLSGHITFS